MSGRIVIIGGGIIGLCGAYYAAGEGFRVTLVDRQPEQRDGCSYGNAGMIVPSHFVPLAAPGMVALGLKWMGNPESPFYLKPRLSWELFRWGCRFWRAASRRQVERAAPLLRDLHLASLAGYEALAALPSAGFELTQRGLLMLCKTAEMFDKEAKLAALANELGVPAEVLDARQTGALDPGVSMDVTGSVFFPQDAHLSPGRLMASLQKACEQLGVEFLWSTEVCGWSRRGSRIESVRVAGGEIAGDEFILCGGSWSPAVIRSLGLRLSLQAGKGYSLTLTQPRELPQLCSILTEARVAVTPMGGTLRFGGTMEIAGLNEDVQPGRVRGIIRAAPRYFPKFAESDFAGLRPWVGLRPCSPDGLPYLGRTAKFANLIVATGHGMMGISLGPITGRLVTQILSGEKPSHDLELLSPDRFG